MELIYRLHTHTMCCISQQTMLRLVVLLLIGEVFAAPVDENLDWWQTAVFYQIYPRSFKDSDGDGVGDLTGITQKLDHLKDLGVNGVWLSPIYKSPMADFGYDIADFRDIDPLFGTMEDFDRLLDKCKELGIKFIMDFVPNHSSDEHIWFQLSLQKVDPFTDYYTWRDGRVDSSGKRIPPNNWQSMFGGPAWTWREERQQYYLHQFDPKQPDLNYSNPKVVEEMKDVLRFWLDKGVNGFRVDAISTLFEGPIDVPDSETSPPQDQPATYDMVTQWRTVLDQKTAEGGDTRVMMLEVYASNDVLLHYYGNSTNPGGHFPFNFHMITDLNNRSSADDFVRVITDYLTTIGDHWPNWVLGNHDQHRVASRYGSALIEGMSFISLLLPGTGVTYDGEEIGMVNTYITWEQCRDPQGLNAGPDHYLERTRDLERSPYQWDDSTAAGFSSNPDTWLPVNPNYVELNLKAEKAADRSHYKIYKRIVQLRQQPVIRKGQLDISSFGSSVLAFTRSQVGSDTIVVLVNLGDQSQTVNLTGRFQSLPQQLEIYETSLFSSHSVGETLAASNLEIAPKEAFVFIAKSS